MCLVSDWHLMSRNKVRGESARNEIVESTGNDDIHLELVDVSDMDSIHDFVSRFNQYGIS